MSREALSSIVWACLIVFGFIGTVVFLLWLVYKYDSAISRENRNNFLKKKEVDGLFILDDSDPNTTRWILDMRMDPDEIKNKKEIRLKVCKMDEQGDV